MKTYYNGLDIFYYYYLKYAYLFVFPFDITYDLIEYNVHLLIMILKILLCFVLLRLIHI